MFSSRKVSPQTSQRLRLSSKADDLGLILAVPLFNQPSERAQNLVTGEVATKYNPEPFEIKRDQMGQSIRSNDADRIKWHFDDPAYNFSGALHAEPLNLACWVYWEDPGESGYMMSIGRSSSNAYLGIKIQTQYSADTIEAITQGGGSARALDSAVLATYSFGQWLHIVGQWDGDSWRRLIINAGGIDTTNTSTVSGMTTSGIERIALFGHPRTTAPSAELYMADAIVGRGRLWTDAEVASLYYGGSRWDHYKGVAPVSYFFPPVAVPFGFPAYHLPYEARIPGDPSDVLINGRADSRWATLRRYVP